MKKNISIVKLSGKIAVDARGSVRFVNDFAFDRVKRFYQIENHSIDIIRAFHGHEHEEKFVYVAKGTILLCVVAIDNFEKPSQDLPIQRFVLSSDKPQVLCIPGKHANGFKALSNHSIVLFFSSSTLTESQQDDYLYPYDFWGREIWKVDNR